MIQEYGPKHEDIIKAFGFVKEHQPEDVEKVYSLYTKALSGTYNNDLLSIEMIVQHLPEEPDTAYFQLLDRSENPIRLNIKDEKTLRTFINCLVGMRHQLKPIEL